MKKLLLILLCLPMIGFGQDKLNNKNPFVISDKYVLAEINNLISFISENEDF